MKNDMNQEFKIFSDIVCHSYHMYRQYCCLYENNDQRLALLEEIAHHFFYDLQGMWIERVFLDICKLTDPAEQRNNKNMTLDHWVKKLDGQLIASEKEKIDEATTICHKKRNIIVNVRSKIIAHIDYNVAIKKELLGKIKIEKEDIQEFYDNVQIIMNIISDKLGRGPAPINFVAQKDAEDLVYNLKKAIHYDQLFESNPKKSYEERKQWKYKDA